MHLQKFNVYCGKNTTKTTLAEASLATLTASNAPNHSDTLGAESFQGKQKLLKTKSSVYPMLSKYLQLRQHDYFESFFFSATFLGLLLLHLI
jgi:hypothetical protein